VRVLRKLTTRPWAYLGLALGLGWACTPGTDGGGEDPETQAAPLVVALGPVDGHDLPATDLERVAVGTLAPDFSLETLEGDTLTLSGFRGQQNVLLVFYRGHW
jgi:hypothetical protein